MEITLLGTGSPVPSPDRGGQSQLLHLNGDPVLVDCGPLAMSRLLEVGHDPADVETLVFTHHHFDHNADFFEFVFGSWSVGREALTVIGPEGTAAFVDAIPELYGDDIAYRKTVGERSLAAILDIEVERTTAEFTFSGDGWTLSALPVEHSIETYAYRFEEHATGVSCVVSGDTRRIASLPEFAADADVLIQDCGIAPVTSDPPTDVIRDGLARPMPDEVREQHKRNHCDPEDAGLIAAEAGVDILVLTHLLPYRDAARTRAIASEVYDGTVIVAEDGQQIPIGAGAS